MSRFLSTRPIDLAEIRVALGDVLSEIQRELARELERLDRAREEEIADWKKEKDADPGTKPPPFGYEDARSAVEEAFDECDVLFLRELVDALDRAGFEIRRSSVSCLSSTGQTVKTKKKPRFRKLLETEP